MEEGRAATAQFTIAGGLSVNPIDQRLPLNATFRVSLLRGLRHDERPFVVRARARASDEKGDFPDTFTTVPGWEGVLKDTCTEMLRHTAPQSMSLQFDG